MLTMNPLLPYSSMRWCVNDTHAGSPIAFFANEQDALAWIASRNAQTQPAPTRPSDLNWHNGKAELRGWTIEVFTIPGVAGWQWHAHSPRFATDRSPKTLATQTEAQVAVIHHVLNISQSPCIPQP